MKFSSNVAVQLSEEKPALWFLLLGKLLQLKLHLKSVNSLHQANTWRPAAADPCLWAQSAEGQDPLSVWLRRGEGEEKRARGGGCICFDFTRDLCPLLHKPLIPWRLLEAAVTSFLNHGLPRVHIHHSQVSLSASTAVRSAQPPTSLTPTALLQKLSKPRPLPTPTLHHVSPTKREADPDVAARISVYFPRPQLM